MSFWNTTKFKKLNAKWREKLKRDGFKDLERPDGELAHQGWVGDDLRAKLNFRPGIFEEVRDYHLWAEDMANHGRFRSTLDKRIWTLHAQGRSTHEIAEQVPVNQTTIARRIKKIRDYLLLELGRRKAA